MLLTNRSLLVSRGKPLMTALITCSVLLFTGCDNDTDDFQDSVGESMDDVEESVDETFSDMDMSGNDDEEVVLTAELSGTPNTNNDGSGTSTVTVNRENGEVCYEIETENIEEPTMAHIHSGAEGESGGIVVDFNTPDNGMEGCVSDADSSVLDVILETPENYYVNVHNEQFPAGVIRGQLSLEDN